MAANNPYGNELIRSFIRKFPNSSIAAIGSAIWANTQNHVFWKDREVLRGHIRLILGRSGKENRNKMISTEQFVPTDKSVGKPPVLPKGWEEVPGWKAFKVKGPVNALVIGDIHIPYFVRKSVELALDYAKSKDVDTIVLNGDIIDCYSESHWQRNPLARRLSEELKVAREFLAYVRHMFPKARIIYKIGNHEERHEHFLQNKAPELLGIEEFELDFILRFNEHGIECVRDRRPINLGNLLVLHGHEYNRGISVAVNAARGLYNRAKVNSLCHHFHHSSSHSEKDANDKVTTCWSIGCLSNMHPMYSVLNRWNHGLCRVEVDDKDRFKVSNPRIIEGKIYE